jgi:hypothetical protein
VAGITAFQLFPGELGAHFFHTLLRVRFFRIFGENVIFMFMEMLAGRDSDEGRFGVHAFFRVGGQGNGI